MGREALIKATSATSLGWDDNQEKAVDRIVALGMATRENALGSAILHAEALDEASMRNVILLATRTLHHKHRITRHFCERIVMAALVEHMHPRCRSCGGMPFIEARVATVCPDCKGSGFHRYSDRERSRMIGVTKYPTKAYEAALTAIRDSLSRAVGGANGRLE